MVNEIQTNEARIDEALDTITMSKDGWVHINLFNIQRRYRTDDYIMVSLPETIAEAVMQLRKMDIRGERLTRFIELFEPTIYADYNRYDNRDADDTLYWDWYDESDNNGTHPDTLNQFYDFCTAFKMVNLMGVSPAYYGVMLEFVNGNRDFLIDDESDDKRYLGKFTKVTFDNERYFSLEKAREIFPAGYNQPKD
tara:strand:- start:12672 stop:13256 length:585 start_codon:yes stop_codon:yes gene_type:complete